jgi:hypothetical protein
VKPSWKWLVITQLALRGEGGYYKKTEGETAREDEDVGALKGSHNIILANTN